MFTTNNYEEVLDESKSGQDLIGSAWSVVSVIAVACLAFTAFNYLV
jgi:hypothetical protein